MALNIYRSEPCDPLCGATLIPVNRELWVPALSAGANCVACMDPVKLSPCGIGNLVRPTTQPVYLSTNLFELTACVPPIDPASVVTLTYNPLITVHGGPTELGAWEGTIGTFPCQYFIYFSAGFPDEITAWKCPLFVISKDADPSVDVVAAGDSRDGLYGEMSAFWRVPFNDAAFSGLTGTTNFNFWWDA